MVAGVPKQPSQNGSDREIIQWLEHLIDPHYGNMLTGKEAKISCESLGMGSSHVCSIMFKTPTPPPYIDFELEVETTGRLLSTWSEGADYTGGSLGTSTLPWFCNRNQPGTPSLLCYVYSNPDDIGTVLTYHAQGASGKFGGAAGDSGIGKIRLKTNEYYLFQVTCKEDDLDMSFIATWDEVDG